MGPMFAGRRIEATDPTRARYRITATPIKEVVDAFGLEQARRFFDLYVAEALSEDWEIASYTPGDVLPRVFTFEHPKFGFAEIKLEEVA